MISRNILVAMTSVKVMCFQMKDRMALLKNQANKKSRKSSPLSSTFMAMMTSSKSKVPCKQLPSELLEKILVRLPLPILCRLRLICKEWNDIISGPRFASLRAQVPHRPLSIFISRKRELCPLSEYRLTPRWITYDSYERKSYEMTNPSLASLDNLYRREGSLWKFTLAANGGLIYSVYMSLSEQEWTHIVCNPFSKWFHRISTPDQIKVSSILTLEVAAMAVDRESRAYKIVLPVTRATMRLTSKISFLLYESETTKWQRLHVPRELHYRSFTSSVIVDNIFYSLFYWENRSVPRQNTWLYAHDLGSFAKRAMKVELPAPARSANKSFLVACLNRLFMVQCSLFKGGDVNQVVSLMVWEITLGLVNTTVVKVGQTLQRFSLLGNEDYDTSVVAIGCGDSIVIWCKLGLCVQFDLVKKRWHKVPKREFSKWPIYNGICMGLIDF